MKYTIIIITALCLLSGCGKNTDDNSKNNSYEHLDTFSKKDTFGDEIESSEILQESSETESIITPEPGNPTEVKNKEDKQPLVESVSHETEITESNADGILYSINIEDINTDDLSLDNIPELLREAVIFNFIDELDALRCYKIAQNYLGEISSMELSDWLSTTHYDNAYTIVMMINELRYKYIIYEDKILLTDII